MAGSGHDSERIGELRELLRIVPLFSGLQDAELDELGRLATLRHYAKDGVVFFEKDVGASFFMIERGRIKVSILGDDGREVILSVLGPGDFFGEMALLDDEPRSATAIAAEATDLISVSRSDFQSAIDKNPEILRALVGVLMDRVRKANHQISTLALLDVYGRVARVLIDMAREEGKRLRDGSLEFRRATHQEIANRIGTTRETVTRMLKDLERQDLIKAEGRLIVLRPDFEKEFEDREAGGH